MLWWWVQKNCVFEIENTYEKSSREASPSMSGYVWLFHGKVPGKCLVRFGIPALSLGFWLVLAWDWMRNFWHLLTTLAQSNQTHHDWWHGFAFRTLHPQHLQTDIQNEQEGISLAITVNLTVIPFYITQYRLNSLIRVGWSPFSLLDHQFDHLMFIAYPKKMPISVFQDSTSMIFTLIFTQYFHTFPDFPHFFGICWGLSTWCQHVRAMLAWPFFGHPGDATHGSGRWIWGTTEIAAGWWPTSISPSAESGGCSVAGKIWTCHRKAPEISWCCFHPVNRYFP